MINNIKYFFKSHMPDNMVNLLRVIKNKHNSSLGYEKIETITDKLYFDRMKKHINWEKPETYTEKTNYSKIYNSNELKTLLTDKASARKWVANKIGDEYIVPLIGIFNSFSEICFDDMPDSFVLKCTHDSGSVKVITDKSRLTRQELNKLLKLYDQFYLKRNYGYKFFEMQYVNIEPKIIVEKYLGDNIRDYKFLCFDGKPYYCWVDVDRFTNHKRNIYDLNWNLQPFNQMTYGNYSGIIEKPNEFEKMVDIATTLCKGFDHVRVDLYCCDNKVYFGEMTFTNGSGLEIITPAEWDKKLGDLWNLDTSTRNKRRNGV